MRNTLSPLQFDELSCVTPGADFRWSDFDADLGIPLENISAVTLGRHLGASAGPVEQRVLIPRYYNDPKTIGQEFYYASFG